MELRQDLGRRHSREKIYADVSEEDLFELRKEAISYVVGHAVSDEKIEGLDSGSRIAGLDYRKRKEKGGFFEFFSHRGNGRRAHLGYYNRGHEVHLDYS